ncbi:MAG TPA: nucleotidyl transferase AbiEii/AbiGii toxin family protein [Thermodesulfobacteriota bacterium]|nr:nucleotidyl transferase AbiEii/AbiGii toxin family protein [Thermodesulfobacteriota bacterium]
MTKQVNLDYHENADEFRDAINFTASETGFSAQLIEKDYYCSLILHDFEPLFQQGIIFKGGTCLSKIHADFYRLSEDLDFLFSIETNSLRSKRRETIQLVKKHEEELSKRIKHIRIEETLKVGGRNESRHYVGKYSYGSGVTGRHELIKVEISLREQILEPVEKCHARTILINPFRNEPAIEPVPVNALSIREAYGEKFRAALTRREPEIRDFYDVDYAIRTGKLVTTDTKLLELVRNKLAVPGNDRIDTSDEKLTVLSSQLKTRLKPVVRDEDYQKFDLDRAFGIVKKLRDSL